MSDEHHGDGQASDSGRHRVTHRASTSTAWMRAAFGVIVLLLSFAAPVEAGPIEDASAAYYRGDYATALRLWVRWPIKATPARSTISASCTTLARACRRTIPRRGNGIASPPIKASLMRSTISASCTTLALPSAVVSRQHVPLCRVGSRRSRRQGLRLRTHVVQLVGRAELSIPSCCQEKR